MTQDDALGGVHVSLEPLRSRGHIDFVEKLPTQGTVTFSIGWTPATATASPALSGGGTKLRNTGRLPALAEGGTAATGTLRVLLHRGVGLPAADLNGKSDPYVVALSGGVQRKSKVVKATLDPIWNETLDLPGVLADFQASGLSLHAYDWDRLSADDPLGSVHIPLDRLSPYMSGESAAQIEYIEALPTHGSLLFSVSWLPDDTKHPLHGSSAVSRPPPAHAVTPLAKGRLQVTLKRAYGLKAADWNGKSDPYVKVGLSRSYHGDCPDPAIATYTSMPEPCLTLIGLSRARLALVFNIQPPLPIHVHEHLSR